MSSNKANAENTPPHLKQKVRGGIQGASRRRRARAAAGPNDPRYAVEQAKHRRQSVNVGLSRPSDPSSAGVSMTTISIPRYLARPPYRDIAKEAIASAAPELAGTPLDYIRGGLQLAGPLMLQVLAGVKMEPDSNVLPKELTVVMNDLTADMPTHMLAVYSRDVPTSTRRRVTLHPIHHIILATYCANLPVLPQSHVGRPDTPGSTISVPVIPLCIPAPDVFPLLSTFLYTKRIDHLLATLLPCPVPPPLYYGDPKSERVLELLQQFARELAADHGTHTLLSHAMTVTGVWRNVCSLGINDKDLWCALDVAWEVLVNALIISTGREH